jgi:hypothetical protein
VEFDEAEKIWFSHNPFKHKINSKLYKNPNIINEIKINNEELVFDDNETIFRKKPTINSNNIKCPDETNRTILHKNSIGNSKISDSHIEDTI